MLSRILIFGLLVSNLFGNDRWSSNIDYKEVIAKAQSGSAYFQGLLGIYLRSGESGCMVDAELSRQWSEVSSKQGHPFGTYNLANLAILNGDFEKATNLYQDAALLLQRKASDGDPVAMYCMGEIDFQVIPTNVPRALDWFKKSAEMGYPQAQATVGALYLKGLPGLLEKDENEGIQLLSKAVLSKSLTARYNLGMAYYNGDGVLKNMEKAIQTVYPRFNTAVIFTTTSYTFHGHPDPLNCPENRSRKSLAYYYFSTGRPQTEVSTEKHSTLFKERKGESFKAVPNIKLILRDITPPIFIKAAKRLLRK